VHFDYTDDHTLQMTAVSLSYDSFIFGHLRWTHTTSSRHYALSYAMRFHISFFLRFRRAYFCVFITVLYLCVAFS